MSVLFTRRGGPPPARDIASNLSVGESVYMNVNGVSTEFIVIHQGNPDPYYYNAACDGTWVMMKGTTSEKIGCSTGFKTLSLSRYGAPWPTYFNETFLPSLDPEVQDIIKTVKLPAAVDYESVDYSDGSTEYDWTVVNKDDGFETKIFALSANEMGYTFTNYGYNRNCVVGSVLKYFETDAQNRRIAYLNGSAVNYQTRSPAVIVNAESSYTATVDTTGAFKGWDTRTTYYGRPAFILPYNARFDTTTKEFLGLDNVGYGK